MEQTEPSTVARSTTGRVRIKPRAFWCNEDVKDHHRLEPLSFPDPEPRRKRFGSVGLLSPGAPGIGRLETSRRTAVTSSLASPASPRGHGYPTRSSARAARTKPQSLVHRKRYFGKGQEEETGEDGEDEDEDQAEDDETRLATAKEQSHVRPRLARRAQEGTLPGSKYLSVGHAAEPVSASPLPPAIAPESPGPSLAAAAAAAGRAAALGAAGRAQGGDTPGGQGMEITPSPPPSPLPTPAPKPSGEPGGRKRRVDPVLNCTVRVLDVAAAAAAGKAAGMEPAGTRGPTPGKSVGASLGKGLARQRRTDLKDTPQDIVFTPEAAAASDRVATRFMTAETSTGGLLQCGPITSPSQQRVFSRSRGCSGQEKGLPLAVDGTPGNAAAAAVADADADAVNPTGQRKGKRQQLVQENWTSIRSADSSDSDTPPKVPDRKAPATVQRSRGHKSGSQEMVEAMGQSGVAKTIRQDKEQPAKVGIPGLLHSGVASQRAPTQRQRITKRVAAVAATAVGMATAPGLPGRGPHILETEMDTSADTCSDAWTTQSEDATNLEARREYVEAGALVGSGGTCPGLQPVCAIVAPSLGTKRRRLDPALVHHTRQPHVGKKPFPGDPGGGAGAPAAAAAEQETDQGATGRAGGRRLRAAADRAARSRAAQPETSHPPRARVSSLRPLSWSGGEGNAEGDRVLRSTDAVDDRNLATGAGGVPCARAPGNAQDAVAAIAARAVGPAGYLQDRQPGQQLVGAGGGTMRPRQPRGSVRLLLDR